MRKGRAATIVNLVNDAAAVSMPSAADPDPLSGCSSLTA
jgi:hypothetical protein